MAKRVTARRSLARWFGGVALLSSVSGVVSCGPSPEAGALFDETNGGTGGDASLGGPSVTSSGSGATAGSDDGSSGSVTSGVTPTTSGGFGGATNSGGSTTEGGGGAGANGGTAGMGGGGAGGSGTAGVSGAGSASDTGGTGGSDTGGTGGASSGGSGGVAGAGGAPGGAGGDSSCGLAFEPRPNTVYFALDRSSSMVDDDFWDPVKEGVIETVAALQKRMRFGFAAFTGQYDLSCPLDLTTAAKIGLDNLSGISAVLDPLEPPDPEGVKGETPTAAALAAVRANLALDAAPGEVYVLLITDGDPDFCDDGDTACASDALVYELQTAYLEGIETRVFNIAGGAATASRLEAFARAGRGLSVQGRPGVIHANCAPDATWLARLSALGRENGSLGDYVQSAPGGTYATLDPKDPSALEATLVAETAALSSCFFDLTGGTLASGEEAAVSVRLGGESLTQGDADGWTLHQGSLLELTGAACAEYKRRAAPTLSIDLDCSVLE